MESRSSCNYCDRTFAHRSSLSRHLRDNHADRGDHKSIECDTCNARYVNNYTVCMSCELLKIKVQHKVHVHVQLYIHIIHVPIYKYSACDKVL